MATPMKTYTIKPLVWAEIQGFNARIWQSPRAGMLYTIHEKGKRFSAHAAYAHGVEDLGIGHDFDAARALCERHHQERMETMLEVVEPAGDLVRDELLTALKAVEWAGRDSDGDSCCPACEEFVVMKRHAPDCRLAAAIAKATGGKT